MLTWDENRYSPFNIFVMSVWKSIVRLFSSVYKSQRKYTNVYGTLYFQCYQHNGHRSHVDIFLLFSSCTDSHVFENEKRLRRKPREIWWSRKDFRWCSVILQLLWWNLTNVKVFHLKTIASSGQNLGNVFNAFCGSSITWNRGSIDR